MNRYMPNITAIKRPIQCKPMGVTSFLPTGTGRDLHVWHGSRIRYMPRTGFNEAWTDHSRFAPPTLRSVPMATRTAPLVHSRSWEPNGTGRDTFTDNRAPYVHPSEASRLRNYPRPMARNLGASCIESIHGAPLRAGSRGGSRSAVRRARARQRSSAIRLSTPQGISLTAYAALRAASGSRRKTQNNAAARTQLSSIADLN